MSKSVIRIAKPEDAEELLKIYAPYVKHTAIHSSMRFRRWKSFETE